MSTDFHFNITNLSHHDIEEILQSFGVVRVLTSSQIPDYKVSRCCAVHCKEVYAYNGRNPGYCVEHAGIRKNTRPQGVPYGQSKL